MDPQWQSATPRGKQATEVITPLATSSNRRAHLAPVSPDRCPRNTPMSAEQHVSSMDNTPSDDHSLMSFATRFSPDEHPKMSISQIYAPRCLLDAVMSIERTAPHNWWVPHATSTRCQTAPQCLSTRATPMSAEWRTLLVMMTPLMSLATQFPSDEHPKMSITLEAPPAGIMSKRQHPKVWCTKPLPWLLSGMLAGWSRSMINKRVLVGPVDHY